MVLRLAGLLFLALFAVIVFFVWSQNYAIGKEESIKLGDTTEIVESKKGLLRSKEIDIEDVNIAYHSEDWLSFVETQDGTIRSYFVIGSNFPLLSGFVVVFDGNDRVFVVIPTNT